MGVFAPVALYVSRLPGGPSYPGERARDGAGGEREGGAGTHRTPPMERAPPYAHGGSYCWSVSTVKR